MPLRLATSNMDNGVNRYRIMWALMRCVMPSRRTPTPPLRWPCVPERRTTHHRPGRISAPGGTGPPRTVSNGRRCALHNTGGCETREPATYVCQYPADPTPTQNPPKPNAGHRR